ncbi:hypothetical protein HNY73_017864 [Argiope bruennichi]|uniref:Uncharacterized protein n=1 Tax=Argiope bruennichi TaxID=94029 RepID=A0A8T0EC74_ARGBR|nr:hypothetical protein HNY73_017864 [Argiope bruennichi]
MELKKAKEDKVKETYSLQELCQTPDTPTELPTSIELVSKMDANKPLRNEDLIYPDIQPHSTILFQTEGMLVDNEKEDLMSEIPSETFKRRAEEELMSTKPKKIKGSDSLKLMKPAISDDVIMTESPKMQNESVDLIDNSHSILKLPCSSTTSNCLGNRLPDRPNTTSIETNSIVDVVDMKSINWHAIQAKNKQTNSIADVVDTTSIDCHTIQTKTVQNKTCENNSDANAGQSYIDICKSIDPPMENHSPIEMKIEKRILNKINDEDRYCVVHPLDNDVHIKVEQGKLNENNTEVIIIPSHVVVSRHPDITSYNSRLRCELDRQNDDNRGSIGQICISNVVSGYNAKNMSDVMNAINDMLNSVCMKMNQNENNVLSDNYATVPNFSFDVNPINMNYDDHSSKNAQNDPNENCEFNDSYMAIPSSSSVSYTEIISQIKHLLDVINEQQTKEAVKDMAENCPVSNEEAQKNEVSDENESNIDSSANDLKLGTLVKIETETMEFQETACNDVQSNEDVSQKSTNSNIETLGFVSSETTLANAPILISIPFFSGDDFFGGPSILCEPIFYSPALQYFNRNTKDDIFELPHTISARFSIKSEEENLGDEMQQNDSPNLRFESCSEVSESSSMSVTTSQTEDSETDNCLSTICLLPSDDNNRSETSNDLSIESKENPNEELFSKEFLRQILNNAKAAANSNIIANINASSNPPVDSMVESNIIIEENVSGNPREINLPQNNSNENMNCITDTNEKSKATIKHSEISLQNLPVPGENVSKQTQEGTFKLPTKHCDTCEAPRK